MQHVEGRAFRADHHVEDADRARARAPPGRHGGVLEIRVHDRLPGTTAQVIAPQLVELRRPRPHPPPAGSQTPPVATAAVTNSRRFMGWYYKSPWRDAADFDCWRSRRCCPRRRPPRRCGSAPRRRSCSRDRWCCSPSPVTMPCRRCAPGPSIARCPPSRSTRARGRCSSASISTSSPAPTRSRSTRATRFADGLHARGQAPPLSHADADRESRPGQPAAAGNGAHRARSAASCSSSGTRPIRRRRGTGRSCVRCPTPRTAASAPAASTTAKRAARTAAPTFSVPPDARSRRRTPDASSSPRRCISPAARS